MSFALHKDNEESVNLQEVEEDPNLISDAESVVRDSPIIEIFDDASNLGAEHL